MDYQRSGTLPLCANAEFYHHDRCEESCTLAMADGLLYLAVRQG